MNYAIKSSQTLTGTITTATIRNSFLGHSHGYNKFISSNFFINQRQTTCHYRYNNKYLNSRPHTTISHNGNTITMNTNNSSSSLFHQIKQALSKRPIEYFSIPAVAAFVGISTNWMGVQMLFYPIEYFGLDYKRFDHTPYGLFGWQGVVPARTEKMASRLVDIVTKDLLTLKEVFGRLNAKELASLLVAPVYDAIYHDCGKFWALAVKPFLPFLLEQILIALQRDIDDVLDLPQVVMEAFVRDKIILVNLFQQVGKVELEFLVKSGFGFGFILGLGQMVFWAIKPKPWTLPVVGALVGYITNWIAIKLLFEPAEPLDCGLFVLQGLFESRQVEVSDEFAHFMQSRVLTSAQLLDALSNRNSKELHSFLRGLLPYPIPEHIINAAIHAIRDVATNTNKYDDIHKYVTTKLDIENTLSSRLKLLSPKTFENLLHPVFQEDEIILIIVGGILGAIAGILQTKLGWGGHGAKVKAAATIASSLAFSAFFFVNPGALTIFESKEEQIKMNEYDSVIERAPPTIRRRNTIIRENLSS